LIQAVAMPTQEVDVLKLGNLIQKLLNNVSCEARLTIVDNDKKNIFFLLKKMDRYVIDHFDSFNYKGKVIAFESAMKVCFSVDELSNMDAFRNATANKLSAEDIFANLHPLVRVCVCVSCSKTSTMYGPQLFTEERALSYSISIC
jgi:hypothetical protein